MIEGLIKFFAKSPEETKNLVPEEYCPNCWGSQEYDKKVRELYQDQQIDVNNHKANYSFIKEVIVTNLNGIHLVKGNNNLECPTCRMTYASK